MIRCILNRTLTAAVFAVVFVDVARSAIRADRRRRRYETVMRERAERMTMQWRVIA